MRLSMLFVIVSTIVFCTSAGAQVKRGEFTAVEMGTKKAHEILRTHSKRINLVDSEIESLSSKDFSQANSREIEKLRAELKKLKKINLRYRRVAKKKVVFSEDALVELKTASKKIAVLEELVYQLRLELEKANRKMALIRLSDLNKLLRKIQQVCEGGKCPKSFQQIDNLSKAFRRAQYRSSEALIKSLEKRLHRVEALPEIQKLLYKKKHPEYKKPSRDMEYPNSVLSGLSHTKEFLFDRRVQAGYYLLRTPSVGKKPKVFNHGLLLSFALPYFSMSDMFSLGGELGVVSLAKDEFAGTVFMGVTYHLPRHANAVFGLRWMQGADSDDILCNALLLEFHFEILKLDPLMFSLSRGNGIAILQSGDKFYATEMDLRFGARF
ncbi:MAG: hypothetical protein HOG08_00245 [Candidatus Magasanikbacteria bacterium]|jgi:hypothetical protein|nr:hypothetical protein [Candidatus Magasanikbacteria bacterium]